VPYLERFDGIPELFEENPDHVAIVKQGVHAIAKFQSDNPDVRFRLLRADLRGTNLSGANLRGANLAGADLLGANLSGVILREAKLLSTQMRRVNLKKADLCGAILSCVNLREANLCGAKLISAELSSSDLSNADLRGVNLLEANLSSVILSGSNLRAGKLTRAILAGAELISANLSNATLVGVDLSGANLQHANLSEARLMSTNLTAANLEFTEFKGSRFCSTNLGNVDLSQSKSLETVQHIGPSTLGIDTLLNSKGRIPTIFLRGCGLPDDFIAFLPSFTNQPFEYYTCFISYSSADKQFARQLHDRLQGKGIRCWLDEKELVPGQKLYDGIESGIRLRDKVLLCCSKHSLGSWWVDNEISIALGKEREHLQQQGKENLSIIPLNPDDHLFGSEWTAGYRQQIRDRVAANFTTWKSDADEFERQLERVIKALKQPPSAPAKSSP
jgi:uncharacterized protein YjbI with pentapeptide repeats